MTPTIQRLKTEARKAGVEWPPEKDADMLTRLALEPQLIAEEPGWGKYLAERYVARPLFVLWFMYHVRNDALAMPPAQHWVSSPIHARERDATGNFLKDDAIADRIRELTGEKVNTRSVESARRKLRVSQRKAR